MHKKCYNLHTSRELVSPVCLSPSCLQADWASARNAVKFWLTFVMSTTSNQFESQIFRSNFLTLVVAAQDYDMLHSSHFPEIPGGPNTVKSLAPICSSTASIMFPEPYFRQTHTVSQRQIKRKDYRVRLQRTSWLFLEKPTSTHCHEVLGRQG